MDQSTDQGNSFFWTPDNERLPLPIPVSKLQGKSSRISSRAAPSMTWLNSDSKKSFPRIILSRMVSEKDKVLDRYTKYFLVSLYHWFFCNSIFEKVAEPV